MDCREYPANRKEEAISIELPITSQELKKEDALLMENFVKIKSRLFCLTLIPFLLHMSGCCFNNAEGNNKTSPDVLNPSAIVLSEFIFEKAPFAQCHASTIAETKHGLIAAWFGGSRESEPDVSIWMSRRGRNGWLPVEKVADGSELSWDEGALQTAPDVFHLGRMPRVALPGP